MFLIINFNLFSSCIEPDTLLTTLKHSCRWNHTAVITPKSGRQTRKTGLILQSIR